MIGGEGYDEGCGDWLCCGWKADAGGGARPRKPRGRKPAAYDTEVGIDCIMFTLDGVGRPKCTALKDVYCVTEYGKRCAFQRPRVYDQGDGFYG